MLSVYISAIFPLFIFFLISSNDVFAQDPLLTLSIGKVKGRIIKVSDEDKPVEVYYGIPYATVPLRFGLSQPVKPWNNIFEANQRGFSCWQIRYETFNKESNFTGETRWNNQTEMSEACLTMNIWRPAIGKNFPVMIWIYGSFSQGSANLDLYDGALLAARQNVIVITFDYRVSSFGFLTVNDPSAPPNVGLRDQEVLIQLIKNNMKALGAKFDSVTLVGESSGAASITVHMMRQISGFSQVALESGAAFAHWATVTWEEGLRRSKVLAANLNCPTNSDSEMLKCLRAVPPNILKDSDWIASGVLELSFVPVIDGKYIIEPPLDAFVAGRFKSCPALVGSNGDEGWFWILYAFPQLFYYNYTMVEQYAINNFELFAQKIYEFYPQWPLKPTNEFIQKIIHLYTPRSQPKNGPAYIQAINDMMADRSFVCSVNDLADYLAKKGAPVYKYYFDVVNSKSGDFPSWMGSLHGNEISYFFGVPLRPKSDYFEIEKSVSAAMQHDLATFIKYGKPKPKIDIPARPSWKKFNVKNFWIYHYTTTVKSSNGPSTGQLKVGSKAGDVRRNQCAWWKYMRAPKKN